VNATSNARLYGKGVFTTIRLFDGKPFLLDKHWRRLQNNATKVGISLDKFSEENTHQKLIDLISEKEISDGRVRITLFDETSSSIWPPSDHTQKTSLEILIGDLRPLPSKFCFGISPYSINSHSPIAGVKSCNYLEPIMSLDEAKNRGFHEAIRINERGFVTSGCMANVFWLNGGELVTPGLTTGCLAGTTREFVLENIDCREVEVGIEALDEAETIFLTSAGIGAQQVAEFEGKRLEKVDHPILHLLPY